MVCSLTKIRKLSPFEVLMEVAQREFQVRFPCYCLLLESKNKIPEEQIKETLRILFRNIDILQFCIRQENGVYWFYKMAEEKIPLKVLNNQSPDDIFINEIHTSIDSASGPLWRGTYITNNVNENVTSVFTSNFLLTFHHAIIDGYTAFSICNSFLKVLNDVIGENVQKSYDFGQRNDGQETELLAEQRIEYLKKNSEYLNEIKAFFDKFNKQKIWLIDYFPVPKDVEKKTKYIHGEIDEETNSKLIKIFKSEGITFHAGFCSALNWVFMEILSENGLVDENVELPTEHSLNIRRYWKNCSSKQLGLHIASLKILSQTGKITELNFFDYAKEFNNSLKWAIENFQGIDSKIIGEPQMNYSEMLKNSTPTISYYVASNMGDVSSILQGRGDHVSIKRFKRGASCHASNKPFLLFIQTYEGRFIYSIAYSTHLVTDDLANLCVKKLISKLKIISKLR